MKGKPRLGDVRFRSYGSVLKAIHRKTGRTVAIKLVPVEAELKELTREIEILKSCQNRHIVRYYGSYFKKGELWVMFFE